jgi:UDP-2-acetamido-3-amino-2,3-dideoxy-glucuronate N-acetyltransferase
MNDKPSFFTPQLVDLQEHIDSRGMLVVAEIGHSLPFVVERMFVVSGVPEGEPRGIHAHRVCHQFLVCVAGSVKAMADDGIQRQVFTLDSPTKGLHLPPLTWGAQFDYSADAVLIVLASHTYDEHDYIHDFDTFTAEVTKARPESV